MKDTELLQTFVNFLPFLADVLGKDTEILIHDLNKGDHSLIAIENNISGRKIGSGITDWARKTVENGINQDKSFISSYKAQSKGKSYVSHTFFIKNNGKVIGLLCINKDTKASEDVMNALIKLFEKHNLLYLDNHSDIETLDDPFEDILINKIHHVISLEGISVDKMNFKEKKKIVKMLHKEGLLKQRGGVNEAAKQLEVSVPSIYRYINK